MNRQRSRSPPRPPSVQSNRSRRQQSNHRRAYASPQRKTSRRRAEIKLQLAVFHSNSHKWSTEPIRFDPNKINDRQLWSDIRYTFRTDLQKPWRRIFGFYKVKNIVPIGFTPNNVPVRVDPKDFPDSRSFMHAYHHPEAVRPVHEWIDWFVQFDSNDKRQNGLEFVEGLWAEKLAIIAIIATIAIVATSIVWCALGGNLQTVFTVMSFVLTLVAAQIALAALYYQVALPN